TTSTTAKDGDGDDDGKTTSTTVKDGDGDVSPKAAFNTAAADKDTTATTAKSDASKAAAGDDCDTTTTTAKGGKGSTTTTRKSGDGKDDGKSSTTTTERKDRPTTTTTERTVEPTTPPSGGGPSGGGDSGGSTDPGSTPIEPQEAPPFDPSVDQPADDPGAEPGVDEEGWYEMPEEGPVAMEDDEYAFGPMPAPGEAQPVIPTLSEYRPRSNGKASVSSDRSRRTRDRSGRDQKVAAAPFVMSSSGAVQAAPGQTQSAEVSRNLGGLKTSVTESAFPADIISTPRVFPINRRDPLGAAALVLLVGVSRELFKVWRRRASDYWPA
ncbi:MAG TPA: hypothetical protein VF180_04815, partial [Acidimicrobiia bacterium]